MSGLWMSCESRSPWVTNSLVNRVQQMRAMEAKCRRAFTKPWMGEPANYLADAYAEAAALFESKLGEIELAKQEWASTLPTALPQEIDHGSE